MAGEFSLPFEALSPHFTTPSDALGSLTVGGLVTVTSIPEGRINVLSGIRDPENFPADPLVHDVVNLGQTLAHLRGEFTDPEGFFADRDRLPDKGVIILSDHYTEAGTVVTNIDRLAQEVIADARLYDSQVFCEEYLGWAQGGYDLLRQHLPHFEQGREWGIPVSLERAGLVTTRLARGLGRDALIDDEVRVVTKRVHPKDGDNADLMVTIKWRNLSQIAQLNGTTIDVADFVNPAAWTSTAGLLVAMRNRGSAPAAVIHRSIMATEQGIALAFNALASVTPKGIRPLFYTVGSCKTLTPEYYLVNPAVADAGDALKLALPSWYQP